MSKHTPGPWVIQETNFAQQKNVYAQADKPPIATVYGSTGENEANARLIAAAPEMLDALKKTSEFLHHMWCSANINEYDFEMVEETMLINDAAIAKATGDQP